MFRNHEGIVMWDFSGSAGNCDSAFLEALALVHGLRIIKEKGFVNAIIEGDSSSIISWEKGSCMDPWRLASLIHEIRDLTKELNPSFSLVPIADTLAKGGIMREALYSGPCLP